MFKSLKFLGPGLLMAGAAIGVSHLIQSTRAGADYGFQLFLLVLLINILKYPFFEYGHRYTNATQENLLQGYARLGKFYLYIFILLNIITGIISIAGVTFVTAAIASLVTPQHYNTTGISIAIILICAFLILIGNYKWLDKTIKWIMVVLFISTVAALGIALHHGSPVPMNYISATPWQSAAVPFLIALMGWMPAPIELSVWQSLWVQAKNKTLDTPMTTQQGKIDFNMGYLLTIILALVFLSLGALVMHGSGVTFSNSAPTFASQLITLYTKLLGDWAKWIVIIAAMCTMFSTTLTVIDAYPRSLAAGLQIACPSVFEKKLQSLHWLFIIGMCAIALWFIHAFMHHFKQLIDLATSIAFITAPLFAYLNIKLIHSKHTPNLAKPGKGLTILSLLGLLFLIGFTLLYVFTLTRS